MCGSADCNLQYIETHAHYGCKRDKPPNLGTAAFACGLARGRAQTRQGAPALIRYMQNPENDKCRARAEKRPADGDYGAPTARRDCSGARGGIPMGSTAPMSLAVRAQLPRAVWG